MDKNFTVDTDKIVALLDEAYAGRINDLNHSTQLANTALSLSREINNNELIGKSLNHLSLFYMIQGEYKRSIGMAEEAIKYFEELHDDKGIADARYSIAGNYYKTDNYHLGLIYLINCLTTYRKYNDYHNQARTQKSLGTIYEYFGDQKNAIKSYEGAIEAARQAKDINLESNAYNPLSGIYLKQGKTKEALDLIERSIAMKNKTGDIRGLAFALYGLGKIHISTGQFDLAEEDLQECISIHQQVGEKLGLGMAYHRLADLYMRMDRLKEARRLLEQTLDFSDAYNIVIIKFKCDHLLYQIHKKKGNTVLALEYLERYLSQKEAVINTQTLQIIENYELITRMESLEKEAKLQKEKDEIIKKKELAEQSAKVKQDFLSTMSHEIRTPLNAVITITSLLKDRSDEEEQRLLNSLKFASNNLLLIINDILDFTKLEAGKMQLDVHPCNFRTLIENLRHIYENLATEKGLKLFLNIDTTVAESYELDETKLSQILGNLIGNAIKYTDNGKVEIGVTNLKSDKEIDTLRFTITDTGVGIPKVSYKEIFESFSQPKSITTRKHGGSGLGLAIVKKLVELYKSKVHVNSEVGKGSSFHFDIKTKRLVSEEAQKQAPLDKLTNRSVLLAEDNMINAMVARKLLSNWGIATEHAKNGIEAVEKSKLRAYDFILMDIHMPEMNGFDATKNIREMGNPNSFTPIFALTADITAEHQDEYAGYFNGFLRKPIEIEKLYNSLVNALLVVS
ncbi:tetratricopeptide repeat protein [Mucilaginibacter mali]|uniref:histidine kinase n=1 Tax=Mucilaginibacter mali TaxID=2740462 RepID=A0A7D4QRR6_9SPHI|nr:tetratricopeptide repeat protein [Mucilaginibacter mali]QKJ29729.1 tetratricopeptide repeat protein [Mucilaginibacter mali]